MTWSNIPRNPENRVLRQFAAAWLVFLLAAGARQYLGRGHHIAGIVLMAIAVVFGVLGLARPAAVRWLFVICMVLTFPLGWLISQVVMLLMFYLIITPVSLVFRLKGRDPLARKPDPGRASFWQPKHTPKDVRSYFRQY